MIDNRLLEAFRMFTDDELILLYGALENKCFCNISEDLLHNLYKIMNERGL
jgi:hypothetical protein